MVLVDADGVTIDPLSVRRVLQRVTEGDSVGVWWAVFVGPGPGRGCMAEVQMLVSNQEGRMESLVPWCFMEGLMGWRSPRNAEESQEEMYMKTSQIKGLYTHGTLSQVLVARNNSAFRIFQLLDGLCLYHHQGLGQDPITKHINISAEKDRAISTKQDEDYK